MTKYKLNLILLLFAILMLSCVPNVEAVWKGSPALGAKRAVPIYFDRLGYCVGSGFLYQPRIVFTAAHSVFEGDDRKVAHTASILRKKMWVGFPGQTVSERANRIESTVFYYPTDYASRDFWLGGKRFTRNNDFAVLVLNEPLPVDEKKVELLTPEIHSKFINSEETVSLIGYGAQKAADVESCANYLEPSRYESIVISQKIDTGTLEWTAPLNFKTKVRAPSFCNGDSGAGFFKEYSDRYLYFSAAGAGGYNAHNCETNLVDIEKEAIMGTWPVYLYLDLIRQAEEYVKANPYVAPNTKKAIICVKGKKKKQIVGANPSCPNGFKSRNKL